MSGTILLGYDVETASESTGGFLQGAQALHRRLGVPWAIYLTGKTVEARAADVRPVVGDPLLTVGQHTYSHLLLKSVYMQPGDGQPVHGHSPNFFNRGGSLEQIRDEVGRTQQLLRDELGVACRGLTGPWGYYRGLVDRPDILEILRDAGLRWMRTSARDGRDCQPTPFAEQPFFYADQGFPELLELGIQGYQDDFYWDRFDDRRHGDTYQDYLYAMLGEVAERDWVWNVCSHDHGTTTAEAFAASKGRWLEDLIRRAQDLGIRFLGPEQLYQEMAAAPRPPGSGESR
ncbi:MAG: polysaccharide deacetylase family protein [Gemmatimonadota bacterium]